MDYKAYFGGNIKYNLFSEEIGWHVLSQRSFYGVVPASNEATPRLRQCAAKTFIDAHVYSVLSYRIIRQI